MPEEKDTVPVQDEDVFHTLFDHILAMYVKHWHIVDIPLMLHSWSSLCRFPSNLLC